MLRLMRRQRRWRPFYPLVIVATHLHPSTRGQFDRTNRSIPSHVFLIQVCPNLGRPRTIRLDSQERPEDENHSSSEDHPVSVEGFVVRKPMHNDSFDSHNNNPARLSPSSSSFGPGLLFNSDTAIGRSSSAASLAALAAAIIPVASASGGPAFPSLFEQHRDYLSSSNAFPSASAATSKPAVPAARAQYPLLDLHQPSLSSLSIPAMVRSSTTEEIGTFTTTDPASRRASNKAPTASVVSEIESFSDASGFARKGLVQKGMAHEMEMEMEKGSLDIADSEDEGERESSQ